MDPYESEEDQIRALKQWWADNGSSMLIGIGLAVAIVFGWQWWQQRQQSVAEQAAVLYQEMLQALENSTGDEVQRKTAEHLADELQKIGPAARLGDYALLVRARLTLEAGDLAASEQSLAAVLERNPDSQPARWLRRAYAALGRAPDPELGALVRVRLARVQFAAGKNDQALDTLAAATGDDFLLQRQELRGDILLQRGDHDGALQAYRAAVAASGGRVSPLLQMKLRELELAQAASNAPVETAVTASATGEHP